MTTNLFNPFAIFGCKVQRRFLIRPREYDNYTTEQLMEEVDHKLRIFIINKVVWFLGKDVTSFLGITPDHSSRIIKKIDQHYILQEKVNITGAPHEGSPSKRCKQITTKMYLVNEPGIYALIQKSKTMYAEIFKTWLNEKVLPSIRTSGEYKADSILQENILETYVDQDQREFEVECMGKEEYKEYKEEIALKFQEPEIIQQEIIQPAVVESKEESILDILKSVQAALQQSEIERSKDREEHRKDQMRLESTINNLQSDLFDLKTKMNSIVQDRIVAPEDDSRRELLVIMETGENNFTGDTKDLWRYPYYVIRCQERTKSTGIKRCIIKYPRAKQVFEIAQPNNQILYDVVKSKSVALEIHVEFYRNNFYFADDENNIRDLINLINNIEIKRTRV